MKTIYKYFILPIGEFSLDLPIGASILSFQTQGGDMCLWVMVDKDADIEQRHFKIHGTGRLIKETANLHYIGTTQMSIDPPLVWHLFEEIRGK